MAAPMNGAKYYHLLRTNSKYLDLFKSKIRSCSNPNKNRIKSEIRSYSNPNRNKKNSKKSAASKIDFIDDHTPKPKSKSKNAKQRNQNLSDLTFPGNTKFADILSQRAHEASHTVLVRTRQPSVTLQKLQSVGSLEYAGFTSVDKGYILAQYKNSKDLLSLTRNGSTVFASPSQFPMQTRALIDYNHIIRKNREKVENRPTVPIQEYPTDRLNFSYEPNTSLDQDILVLDSHKTVTDFDLRLRFYVCDLLQSLVRSMLPEAQVIPYGSCLNGFGWWDGDLDMMVSLDPRIHNNPDKSLTHNGEDIPFRFMTQQYGNERQLAQNSLSAMAVMIELMPLMVRVMKILNAKVPIIRFSLRDLDLQCDLSLYAIDHTVLARFLHTQKSNQKVFRIAMLHESSVQGKQSNPTKNYAPNHEVLPFATKNMRKGMFYEFPVYSEDVDSIKMTEMLYLLSATDPRVRPLLTTIKQWALHQDLTSSGDHQKPTTLGLLCLLIFYLQTCQPAVLPSLKKLHSLADVGDRFEIDRVTYSLPACPTFIPPSTNTQTMEELIRGFFDFFASFDFESQGISIIEGSSFTKSGNSSPLYVENPYRIGLNICRNVSPGWLDTFQESMRTACQVMDGMAKNPSWEGASSSSNVSRLEALFNGLTDADAESMHLVIDSLFDIDGGGGGSGIGHEGHQSGDSVGGEGGVRMEGEKEGVDRLTAAIHSQHKTIPGVK